MWGGPTPHNLVTLSLCCAVRTCSEVPITSSDRDTTEAREGRPHSPSLGHPCPGAGSSFTQREVPYDWVSAPRPTLPDASWDHAGDTTHFGRNELKKKDYGRTAQSATIFQPSTYSSQFLGKFSFRTHCIAIKSCFILVSSCTLCLRLKNVSMKTKKHLDITVTTRCPW